MPKDSMTSRERIHAAAKGLLVDRIPVFIWLNAHTGAKLMTEFKPSRNRSWNLLARLVWKRFVKGGIMDAHEFWRMLPLIFDVHTFNYANAYATELGSDLFLTAHDTPWNQAYFSYKDGHILIRDLYGVTRGIGGAYPDMVKPAIETIEDVKNFKFPDAKADKHYNAFRKFRKAYPDSSIMTEIWGTQDFTATSLFGMEKFMVYLIDYPEEMKQFMRRWADFQIQVIQKSVAAGADMIAIFDDYGYDNRPLISMNMWQEFTLPELKRLVDATHEAGAIALLHSCGFQMPFLEYYVEADIDILQCFQPKAGNDFEKAYQDYGDRLTFMTGIDIQMGEFMSPDEFKEAILKNYRIGKSKPRFVLATTHEIQYTMPDENIRILFETVKEIQEGKYE